MCASTATEITHSGGASEPDRNALAVMPRTWPSASAVITVTPVAKRLMTRRNSLLSTGAICVCTFMATFRRGALFPPLRSGPFRLNQSASLTFCMRMIFPTCFAAEAASRRNRFPLFGIMR